MRPCVPVHERTIRDLKKLIFLSMLRPVRAWVSRPIDKSLYIVIFGLHLHISDQLPGKFGEKGKRKANVSRCAPTEQHRKTRIVYFYELMRSFIHHSHCVFTGRRGKLIWKFNYERRQNISSRKKDPSEPSCEVQSISIDENDWLESLSHDFRGIKFKFQFQKLNLIYGNDLIKTQWVD